MMICDGYLRKTILGALWGTLILCDSSSCCTLASLLRPCSVPEDILEHITPDEFHVSEPSISASWDDGPRQGLHSPEGQHDRRHPDSACTKSSSSSRHSQARGSTRQNALALSSSASSGATAAPPDLPPIAGSGVPLRGSEEGGAARSPDGARYSFAPGSPNEVLCAKISGEDVHSRDCPTPSSIGWTPRQSGHLAHQVTFGEVDLPEPTSDNVAKRRRQQAAHVNKFGPAVPVANIRPASANPAPCQLNATMMIDACGVDMPKEVEVCTTDYSLIWRSWATAGLRVHDMCGLCLRNFSIRHVQEIALSNRGIDSIEIGELPAFSALKALNLENNLITDIAPLGRLESLMQLQVGCNRIQGLPQLSDGIFFSLQVLDVGFNQIPVSEVFARESDWSRLPTLRKLDMSGNHLVQLPDAIGSFPSLQHLTLEYNQLSGECLRPLGRLPKLQVLGLANNHVDEIPMEAFTTSTFNSLTVLDMSRNRIRCEICQIATVGESIYFANIWE